METGAFISHEFMNPPADRASGLAMIRADMRGDRVRAMLSLAGALRDHGSMKVSFVLPGSDGGSSVRQAGFETRTDSAPSDFAAQVRAQNPDLLILDSGVSTRAEAEALRPHTVLLAAIEDRTDCRLACDFAYYPPLPQVQALDWTGARTVPRIGWEFTLPGLDPHQVPALGFSSRPTLLVTMGSGDRLGLTERAARLLTPLDSSFRIRFIIGAEMKDGGRLAASIVALKDNYETVEGANDLSIQYAAADIALCSFGLAACELAAFGVPALYLCLDEGGVLAASAFVSAGMGTSLGLADRATDNEILAAVKALMHDAGRRRNMRAHAMACMKNAGASRIAADLVQALREEKAALRIAR
jgi:spore coat polysaccharide biosynthesis protein SpsF